WNLNLPIFGRFRFQFDKGGLLRGVDLEQWVELGDAFLDAVKSLGCLLEQQAGPLVEIGHFFDADVARCHPNGELLEGGDQLLIRHLVVLSRRRPPQLFTSSPFAPRLPAASCTLTRSPTVSWPASRITVPSPVLTIAYPRSKTR